MLNNILIITREQNNQDLGEDDSNDADYTPGGHGGVDDYPAKRVTIFFFTSSYLAYFANRLSPFPHSMNCRENFARYVAYSLKTKARKC